MNIKSLDLVAVSFAVAGAVATLQPSAMAQSIPDYQSRQHPFYGSSYDGNADWDKSQNNRTWEDFAPPTADTESGHYQNH